MVYASHPCINLASGQLVPTLRIGISGLTDEEAQEFHHYWVQGLVGFVAVAAIAHMLVWAWRPWF